MIERSHKVATRLKVVPLFINLSPFSSDISAFFEVIPMVVRGEITGREAKSHKMKNVITRALGVEENPKVETEVTDLTDDTVIVICSDGVSNVIDDNEIMNIAKENTAKKGAETLCKTAKKLGSTDDITAIVVKVRGESK